MGKFLVKKSFLLILALFCASSAQDLTASKDSLQVYNNPVMSYADAVVLRSSSSAQIHLDSAYVMIAEMDTTGISEILRLMKMEATWKGNTSSTQQYFWTMDSVGLNGYKLTKKEFIPPTDEPLSFSGTGTTSTMFFLQIGTCFICDRMPIYPKYIRGTMSLFFSNGQVVDLKLWSQDLRTAIRQKGVVREKGKLQNSNVRFLANGRRIVADAKGQMRIKSSVRVYAPSNK